MIAHFQKMLVAALVGITAFVAWLSVVLGYSGWAASGAVLLVIAFGMTLAAEFGFLYRSFDRLDPRRPLPRQLVKAWLLEVAATPRIFLWQQPFRSRTIPDSLRAPAGSTRRGTVLVHGFVCNRGLWNRWLRRLRDAGVPFTAIDMEPVFGSIDDYVPIIERAIARSAATTGLSPVVVAHSMGGLAVRSWAAKPGNEARVHRVVTIGSPHQGTWMARHSNSRNGREMRLGSAWLARLEALERTLPPSRFVCFWSHCDNIVFPSRSATLPGADNRHLEAAPHVQMIHHPAVIEEVLRLVDDIDHAPS